MIRPPLGVWLLNSLTASRVQRNEPTTFTLSTFWNAERDMFSMGVPRVPMPAFWSYRSEVKYDTFMIEIVAHVKQEVHSP
jgi:hypothetical protein